MKAGCREPWQPNNSPQHIGKRKVFISDKQTIWTVSMINNSWKTRELIIYNTAILLIADVSSYKNILCCRERTWFILSSDLNLGSNLDFSKYRFECYKKILFHLHIAYDICIHSCLFSDWFSAHSLQQSHQASPATPFKFRYTNLNISILWLERLLPSSLFNHWKP